MNNNFRYCSHWEYLCKIHNKLLPAKILFSKYKLFRKKKRKMKKNFWNNLNEKYFMKKFKRNYEFLILILNLRKEIFLKYLIYLSIIFWIKIYSASWPLGSTFSPVVNIVYLGNIDWFSRTMIHQWDSWEMLWKCARERKYGGIDQKIFELLG